MPLYIGLMSGTSMDGIDAALVNFPAADRAELLHSHSHPWPADILQALNDARQLSDDELHRLKPLDEQLAQVFAEAVTELLKQSGHTAGEIQAIGNHGQTIRHRPDIDQAFSLQLGNGALLAQLCGIEVIGDFRTADIEAGGQGAPLAPAFHQAMLQSREHERVIVNIGGIANITLLPKDPAQPVIGFDTGPGNNLMDAWIQQQCGKPYDANGDFAASGRLHQALLARLLQDNYFRLPPPKSTGFEYFNLQWLQHHLDRLDTPLPAADIQRTLCELTASSIMQAIHHHAPACEQIFICGGGVHNTRLMQTLQAQSEAPVRSSAEAGIHPDWVEAMAFAWLAWRHDLGLPGNLPSVTGAREAVVLGRRNPQTHLAH